MEKCGLRTERGLAFCFNIIFHLGGIHNKNVQEAISVALAEFEKVNHKHPDEVESIQIIAKALIESFKSAVKRVAIARYTLIAAGHGQFLGKEIDLQEREIRLVDFRTGEPLMADAQPE